MATIGDLAFNQNYKREALGQMGQGMPDPRGQRMAQGSQQGIPQEAWELPPELLAQRPKPPTWAKVLGLISDGIRGYQGQAPEFGPRMAEQRQQDEEWQRQVQLAQWKAKIDENFKLADRAYEASKPPAAAKNLEWWQGLDPNQRDAYADYASASRPPQFVQNWDGTRTQVSGGGEAPDTLPPNFFDEEPASAPGMFP